MKNKFLSISLFLFGFTFSEIELLGQATGGTVTISGGRRIHTFTASQSLIYTAATDTLKTVKFTVVGGGGGGGGSKLSPGAVDGSGGGGGGVYDMSAPTPANWINLSFSTGTSIGAGGIGTSSAAGANGGSTEIEWNNLKYYATGGVGGGIGSTGGGASGTFGTRAVGVVTALAAGGGTGGQTPVSSATTGNMAGGSGFNTSGGSGVAGGTKSGGAGGAGKPSSVNAAIYGSGGGGGGTNTAGSGGTNAGSGGTGTTGVLASPTFGGGGGGAEGGNFAGGAGGSGTVILSYDAYDIYNSTASAAYNANGFVNGSATAGIKKCFRGAFTTTCSTSVDFTSDILVIESGHNLTIASGGTLNCGAIWINSGATLTISGGTLNCGPITKNGTLTYTSGTINATYSTSGYSIPATTFGNLSVTHNTAGATTTFQSLANVTVTGTLTITNASNYLILNGGTLTVNAFSGSGALRGSSTSVVVYTGSNSTMLMDQTSESTKTLKYLKLSSGASLTLGNDLVIYGGSGNAGGDVELVQTSASTLTTGGFLTLRFNITSDVHPIIGGLAGISGNVNYEDYFVAGYKAYRQTGSILSGSGLPLSQMTDDFDLYGNATSGTSGPGNNADGLYLSSTSSSPTTPNSIFLYQENASPKWVPFSYTAGTPNYVPRGLGCMFFMRPTTSGATGNYNSQLMDYTGAINNTDFTLGSGTLKYSGSSISNTSGSSNGYNLLANPYAAYLNINDFLETDNQNLDLVVYKYDKASKNYSTYVRKSGSSGTSAPWQKSGITGTDYNQFIDPGDAFWVKLNTTSTTTVVYKVSRTSTTKSGNSIVRGNKMELDSQSYAALGVSMKLMSDSLFFDGVTLFNGSNGGNTTVDTRNGDAYDFISNCNDLSIVGWNNESLSVKSLNNNSSWIVPLKVSTCAKGKGVFVFDIDYNKPGLESTFSLFDKWLNKKFAINVGSKYEFEITDNPNSKGADRFYINMDNSSLSTQKKDLKDKSILCYPNPISKTGTLQVSLPNFESGEIEIKNVMGQLISKIEIPANCGIQKIDLAPLNMLPGTYFVQCKQKTGFIVRSVTVI